MLRSNLFVILRGVLLLPLLYGCGEKAESMKRDPVSKVTGTVLVDGKAEPMISVSMVRVDGPDASATTSKTLTPAGMTDSTGKFVIGTYDGGPEGDGAPNGKYAVIFTWGSINLMGGGRYEGDKFNGKYSDPKKSQVNVEVAGQPVEIPTVELNTKDLPKVKLLPGATEALPAPAK